MKRKLLLSIGALAGLWTLCHAQNPVFPSYLAGSTGMGSLTGSEVTTSTPQTWSFMKYGGDNPHLYTGTVSATIPLYTYKDEDFTLPISLNYASNGYMPNIQANDVGLGWFLDAGGMITRTVRGVPDDYTPDKGDQPVWGYLHGYHPTTARQLDGSHVYWDENFVTTWYHDGFGIDKTETEPDLYTFNFLGHTGNFMLAGDRVHVFNTGSRAAGEYAVTLYDVDDSSKSITIKTGDGYRYEFIARDIEKLTLVEPPATGEPDGVWEDIEHPNFNLDPAMPGPTSARFPSRIPENWHLARIVAPNGRTVTFDYGEDLSEENRDDNQDHCVESYRHTARVKCIKDAVSGIVYVDEESDRLASYREEVVQLKFIRVGDLYFEFVYGKREKEWAYTASGSPVIPPGKKWLSTPSKLDSILVAKVTPLQDTVVLKRYALGYDYTPTTPGHGLEGKNPVLLLKTVHVAGEGTYGMEYYHQDEVFQMHGSRELDHWGYYNGGGSADSGFSSEFDEFYPFFTEWWTWNSEGCRKPVFDKAVYGMLKKMSYPTGGYTTYDYEPHRYRDHVVRDSLSAAMPCLRRGIAEMEAGGVRIKKITDCTAHGTSSGRTYTYEDTNGRSSGHLLNMPVYFYRIRTFTGTGKNAYAFEFWYHNDFSALSYYMDRSHIEYKTVTETYDDGSRVRYDFSNYENAPDRFSSEIDRELQHPNYALCIPQFYEDYFSFTDTARVMPILRRYTNNFFRKPDFEPSFRGKLLAVSHYDPSGAISRKKVYQYDTVSVRPYVESVKLAADRYYIQRSYLKSYPLSGITTHDYPEGRPELSPDHTPTPPDPGEIITPVTTEFWYGYNDLGQMNSTSWLESDGATRRWKSATYVSDIDESERTDVHRAMIAANVLNPIVYSQEFARRPLSVVTLLSLEKYEYAMSDDLVPRIFPAKHLVAEIPHRLAPHPANEESFDYFCETSYDRYDTRGRLIETTDRMGLKTSYVWGYGSLYMVAKVVGVPYTAVEAVLGPPVHLTTATALTPAQDAALRAIPNTLVTTCEYDPHVGITRVKDPFGLVKTYTYNAHGRLTGEYDHRGDPIRTFSYSTDTEN